MMTQQNKESEKEFDIKGVSGSFGPNDGGYIHQRIIKCAEEIKKAQELYSQGHYPHSNAKIIPKEHPLRLVMKQLSKLDEQYSRYNNTLPNESLFSTYEPPNEDTKRWDK